MSGWTSQKLGQIADIRVSGVDKKSYDGEPSVRLCNYTDVYYNDDIVESLPLMEATASPAQIERLKLQLGDVVVTKDSETADDIGIPAYVRSMGPNFVCGYHLAILRPDPQKVDPRYLFWRMKAGDVSAQWEKVAKGVTRVSLSTNAMKSLILRTPISVEDQQSVAGYLDSETAKIDTLIERQQALIRGLRERRFSTIGRRLTPEAESDFGWRRLPLKRTIDFQEGPGILAEDFRDEGVPLLRISSVKGPKVTLEGCNYLDPKTVASRWKHFGVDTGDLIISASASMGTISEVTDPAVVGAIPYTGLIRIKPGHMIAEFARWFFVSPDFMRQVTLLKAGSTMQHFGPSHLAQMSAWLPDAPTQQRIVEQLSSEIEQIDTLILKSKRLIELSKERRAALITAAVTGQIDVAEMESSKEAA